MGDEKTLAPRDMRAARDRIIDRLSDGFANDELDVDEFERRVALAHTASTGSELDHLVEDLPAPAAASEPAPTTRMELVPTDQAPTRQRMLSVLGNTERRGRWQVPRQLTAKTVLGSMVLDFREARFPSGNVELEVKCVLGDLTIIVPPQLAVETAGTNILGNFEQVDRAPSQPDPDAPVLRVNGACVLGNVSVRMRLPGEDWRDATRRLHDERMAQAAELARLRMQSRAERRLLRAARRKER